MAKYDTTKPHPYEAMSAEELVNESLDSLRNYGLSVGIRLKPAVRGRKQAWAEAIERRRTGAAPVEEDEPAEFPADSVESESAVENSAVEELEAVQDDATVTPREARKLESASTTSLRSWLDRHSLNEAVKPCLLEYARLVIIRRENEEAERARLESLRTEDANERFVVEAQARICLGGFVHSLAAGSVVGSDTHDLVELRRQGVKLRKVEIVLTELDLVGQPKTVTR